MDFLDLVYRLACGDQGHIDFKVLLMIFARRAVQRRLTELRAVVDASQVNAIVSRLNIPGKDCLAAMWEVMVMHGLTKHGYFRTEVPLASGRRPDIFFDNGDIGFIADITTVSDEGLDELNPQEEFSELIERAKKRLGLPSGGSDLHIHSKQRASPGGSRSRLALPPRKQLQNFVETKIVPAFSEQMARGQQVLHISIDKDDVALELTIDPGKSPSNTASFGSYDYPANKGKNTLFNALKGKVSQLRGAGALRGIIACDGDCIAIGNRTKRFNSEVIAAEFLRQYSSIGFVLLLTIDQINSTWPTQATMRSLKFKLICQPEISNKSKLHDLFASMVAEMPIPARDALNGAAMARHATADAGFHGDCKISGNKITIGVRELVEILGCLRTLADNGASNVKAARAPGRASLAQSDFLYQLQHGRLPKRITVSEDDENNGDNWVEFDFGETDPAISPFR